MSTLKSPTRLQPSPAEDIYQQIPFSLDQLTLPTLQEETALLNAMSRVTHLQPWTKIDERHVLAVENPETKEVVFVHCTVDGAPAFMAIRGMHGYQQFLSAMEIVDELGEEEDEEFVAMAAGLELVKVPQFRAHLALEEDLDPWMKEFYSRHGVQMEDDIFYPSFSCVRMGYLPWLLDGAETRFLTHILNQVADVTEDPKFKAQTLTPRYVAQGNDGYTIFVCQRLTDRLGPSGEPFWKQERIQVGSVMPPLPDLTVFDAELLEISRKPVDTHPFELDMNSMPLPVTPENERPFVPEAVLMGRRDQVIAHHLTRHGFTPSNVVEVVRAVVDVLKELPKKPAEIWIANPSLLGVAGYICQGANIHLVPRDELPTLTPAWDSLTEGLLGQDETDGEIDLDKMGLGDLDELPGFKLH